MKVEEFAAKRREQLLAGDERIGPAVEAALQAYGVDGWYAPIVREAARIWLENYAAEAPDSSYRAALLRFETRLGKTLALTGAPGDEIADSQIDRITRWVSTYAVNDGTVTGAYRRGVRYKLWVDMSDDKVRTTHRHADGQVVPIGSTFEVGGQKMAYPGEPVGPIELWINCVVGSTQVEGAGQSVLSLSRRESLGSLVEIRTADGHHLTVTPNHPVLTPGGYVPAEALSPGDKVMATGIPVSPEIADAPPSVEEFYRAARKTGNSTRMDGGGVDFHGDAAESEVEVVWPNRDLPLEVRRKFGEPEFIVTDGGELALVSSGLAHPTIPALTGESVGTGDLTLRGVGIGREVAALLSAHAPHPKSVRLAGGPDRQVESIQIPGHDVAADAEVVRHLEYAIAAGMSPSEIVSVEINPVVAATHVYNLHTTANWYSANGIAVHNCRCVAQPAGRSGEAMSANTFDLGGVFTVFQETPSPDKNLPDPEQRTGALVVLLPAESDPITAATSEDRPHMTFVWMGDVTEIDDAARAAIGGEVSSYATALDGPIVVPVMRRGELGDMGADVAFLERSDSILAAREGLMQSSPNVQAAHDAAEQYPEWTPHVTLGYPEGVEGGPAVAEYDGTEVTFDRLGLWLGGDYTEYPMGGVMSDTITADAAAVIGDADIIDEESADIIPVDDDEEDAPEEYEAIPVSGVAAIEGKPTGDGRSFSWEGLTAAPTPQPLGFEFESSHGGDNSRVAIVGRIDRFERYEVGDGTAEMRWWGVIFPHKAYAGQALDGIVDGSYTGLSVIVDEVELDVEATESSFDPTGAKQQITHFKKARIRRFDMVPTGAYYEGYIQLGHAFDNDLTDEDRAALAACGCGDPVEPETLDFTSDIMVVEQSNEESTSWWGPFDNYEAAESWIKQAGDGEYQAIPINRALIASGQTLFAPGTKDGPGWITNPVATSRIRRYWVKGKGAAKIRWGIPGDFNRCRTQLAKYVQNPEWLAGLCANMHREALGIWPAQHKASAHIETASAQVDSRGAQPFTIVAAASPRREYPAEWFADPQFDRKTNLTIDRESGRVYGHLAYFDSCHIGISGVCTTPPRSSTGYAAFLKGVVDTTAGEQRVGCLTYGIGHADYRMRAAAATAHYDQPSAVRAYVNVGEDQFGIWYAGVIRPGVTEEEIDEFRAIGAISGDWRKIGRSLELVAAVGVNTPGYAVSLTASGGAQDSLVLYFEQEETIVASATTEDTEENMRFLAQAAAMAVEMIDNKKRTDEVRKRVHASREAEIRARLTRKD